MNDLVHEAADAVVPLLSAGAGAAVRDAVERGGARLSEAASKFLVKLSQRLAGAHAGASDVELALRAALAEHELSEADLRAMVALRQAMGDVVVQGDAKNNFIRSEIHIAGDFKA